MKFRFRSIILIFLGLIFFSSFSYGQTKKDMHGKKRLHTAFLLNSFAGVDFIDAKVIINMWIEKLVEDIGDGYYPKTYIMEDLSDVFAGLKACEIDMVVLDLMEYIKLSKQIDLTSALVDSSEEKELGEYVFLVHKDAKISELKHLKNKKVSIVRGGRGKISLMWLDVLLLRNGLPESSQYVVSLEKSANASKSILPVFFKKYDACIVTKSAFDTICDLNPQIRRKLTVLRKLSKIPYLITGFRHDYGQKHIDEISEMAINMQKTPEGEQIIKIFHIEKTILFKEQYFNNIKSLMQEYEKYLKQ